jgi:hypothetical protein
LDLCKEKAAKTEEEGENFKENGNPIFSSKKFLSLCRSFWISLAAAWNRSR